MNERRRSRRRKTFKAASIEFSGRAIDCIIRNLSDNGAALDVASVIGVPSEFTLVFRTDKSARKCHVIRRDQKRLSVMFL